MTPIERFNTRFVHTLVPLCNPAGVLYSSKNVPGIRMSLDKKVALILSPASLILSPTSLGLRRYCWYWSPNDIDIFYIFSVKSIWLLLPSLILNVAVCSFDLFLTLHWAAKSLFGQKQNHDHHLYHRHHGHNPNLHNHHQLRHQV